MIVVYGPGMERSEEERDLKRCIEVCEDTGKVVVIGDMNVRVGDNVEEGAVGKFGVSSTNVNGRKLIELFMEKKLNVEILYVF